MIAIAIGVFVALLLAARSSAARKLAVLVTLCVGLYAVALPFITADPEAFTTRGRIWQYAIVAWQNSPLTGLGHELYTQSAVTANSLGFLPTHAHSIAADVLSTSGILGLGSLAILLVSMVVTSRKTRLFGYATVYVATFVAWGTLEAGYNLANLAQMGFITWIVPSVILFQKSGRSRPPSRGGDAEPRP